jgi:glutamate synthase domain-containing protein 3
LNTCPVGIATQDPELRKKFTGTPEHVIRFMFYVAEEARKHMASLGFRTVDEMVGRVDKLRVRSDINHWKASRLDFSDVLKPAERAPGVEVHQTILQDHGVDRSLDVELIAKCKDALESGKRVEVTMPIRNVHRTAGGQLAGEVSRRFGMKGLPQGTIKVTFEGTAGQSFGAWMVDGMEFSLAGDANDYVGKGMAGGVLAIHPPRGSTFKSDENIIVGNAVLYGATGGIAFLNGMAGERFAVRNSGAITVVEGVGDHGCEYMTGGRTIIIGKTGRNFAAGMSGGFAYVLDEDGGFEKRCNLEMVELEAMGTEDAHFVADLLERHHELTRSEKAKRLLSRWDHTVTKFVKVIPIEYRRVLAELERQRSEKVEATAPSHAHA